MDFSQFNPAEQAHMTKLIERKQVSARARPRPTWPAWRQWLGLVECGAAE
jgi:hypothetical protein